MRVFISWSGEPSRSISRALKVWLENVVQHVEAWMSDEDIESGRRWNEEVARQLDEADYGIICLTSANRDRPWMLFEAGALAKRFDTGRVVPLLIDLEPADVSMPLASFQGRALNEEGVRRLVHDMNSLLENPRPNCSGVSTTGRIELLLNVNRQPHPVGGWTKQQDRKQGSD
jgi:TIR domain